MTKFLLLASESDPQCFFDFLRLRGRVAPLPSRIQRVMNAQDNYPTALNDYVPTPWASIWLPLRGQPQSVGRSLRRLPSAL